MQLKKIAIILIFSIIFLSQVKAEEQIVHPTTIESIRAIITVHGNGNVQGLKQGEQATLQILTFQETPQQKINQISEELFVGSKKMEKSYSLDEFGNKYVVFKITENGDFNYNITADITTNAIVPSIENYQIVQINSLEKIYLKETTKVESNSSEIQTLVKSKFLEEDFFKTIDQVNFWVNNYVEYASGEDFVKYYQLQASALETLKNKKGVCDEFANLAAAIFRAKGIPTKIVVGVVFDGREWGNHAWLEVYHPQIGWIQTDPTFNESGFVDGTHIKMGSFGDITLSLAKANYPSLARMNFNTQQLPIVEVIEKKYFNIVSIDSNIGKLKALQWNPVSVFVKNNTNGKIIVPVSVQKNFSEIIVKQNKKTIKLLPGEQKELVFELYPNIELEPNTIALAKLKAITLSKPFEKDYNIERAKQQEDGEIIISDVSPIVDNNTLRIQIRIENFSNREENAKIRIIDGNFEDESIEIIEAFAIKTINKEIPNFEYETYKLKISISGKEQEFLINPVKVIKQNQTEVKINNDYNKGKTIEVQEDLITSITKNPIALLVIVLFTIALAFVIVMAVRKKKYL